MVVGHDSQGQVLVESSESLASLWRRWDVAGDGRREMGDGRWEMGDGRLGGRRETWKTGDGRFGEARSWWLGGDAMCASRGIEA